MIRVVSIIVAIVIWGGVQAQSRLDSIGSLNFTMIDTVSEKLYDLAMKKNLSLQATQKMTEAQKYEWKRVKTLWANNLSASFNLNEGNIQTRNDSGIGNVFFPRYNFNLTIPLGTFLSRPNDSKRARALYEESEIQKKIAVQSLRYQIKSAYQEYLSLQNLLYLQNLVVRDENLVLSQAQKRFQDNRITLEEFLAISKRYNNELVQKVNLTKEVNALKFRLSTLIGVDFDEAMALVGVK